MKTKILINNFSVYVLCFFSFIPVSHGVILTPGEVIQEIENFKESVAKKERRFLYNVYERINDVDQAQNLLTKIKQSQEFCTVFANSDIKGLENFIDRSHSLDNGNLGAERARIVVDCQKCSTYQSQLANHNNYLSNFIFQGKILHAGFLASMKN